MSGVTFLLLITDLPHAPAYRLDGCSSFNRDISQWNIHNVRDMNTMLRYASRFHNTDLSHWDTSRVTDMSYMFAYASHFQGKLVWNTARVKHFEKMFFNADMFSSAIGTWDVSGAFDNPSIEKYAFRGMFDGARDYNEDISHWDIRGAADLSYMFRNAFSYNYDVSNWDIRAVTSLVDMFNGAKSFSQTLCWDIIGKETGNMFAGTLGGGVDTQIHHCLEEKKHQRFPQDDVNTAVVPTSTDSSNNTNATATAAETTTYHVKPLGIRILQGFLMAALVATFLYFVVLLRRYIISQKERRELIQRIRQRATKEHADSKSTSLNISSNRTAVHMNSSAMAEEPTEDDTHDEEDHFCGVNNNNENSKNAGHDGEPPQKTKMLLDLSSGDCSGKPPFGEYDEYDSDDEVEIYFESCYDQQHLRRTTFQNHFLMVENDEDDDMMTVEQAIPAMTTLLQHEALLRQEQEHNRRQDASISTGTPATVSSNILNDVQVVVDPRTERGDAQLFPQWHQQRLRCCPSTVPAPLALHQGVDGIFEAPPTYSFRAKKRIRVPFPRRLEKVRKRKDLRMNQAHLGRRNANEVWLYEEDPGTGSSASYESQREFV